jgi:nucleotide-binding universal stress UspA family protein
MISYADVDKLRGVRYDGHYGLLVPSGVRHLPPTPVAAGAAVACPGMPPTSRDLYADRVADGNALIRTAIDQAVGSMPGDVAVEQQAFSGRPAVELARAVWGGDLLVLGSRRRGWLRRLAAGSVARACARRAGCLVVIVPEPSPSVLQASLPAGLARVPWFRRVPRHGARTVS